MAKDPCLKLMQELGPIAEELQNRGEERLAFEVKKQEEKAKEVTIDYIDKSCKCRTCPTYAECGGNTAFCYYGQSKAPEMVKRNCLCTTCPVRKRLKLPGTFPCINGKSTKFLRQKEPEKFTKWNK